MRNLKLLTKKVKFFMSQQSINISNLIFVNTAYESLPIEQNPSNNVPHKVEGYIYSNTIPTKIQNPQIICLSQEACKLLDLDPEIVTINPDSKHYLSGNLIPETAKPISHNYCGFQFGNWAGQLGDGRAISLGDVRNNNNELWEIQLKGAGKTPYSRTADGRAVLRSSIREFLCSEAMHHLGIPTTRALSICSSDTQVQRDMFYNGNVKFEKCAVVARMAPSFIRFGSFEIFLDESDENSAGLSCNQKHILLPKLLNYLKDNHFKRFEKFQNRDFDFLDMFEEIVEKTAFMVAKWQSVGFCHGVLNTDNMSILGLTIDYGPFGFMDYFDKDFICNHSDEPGGRYSYRNQPSICKHNLLRLAEALKSQIDTQDTIQFVEQNYYALYYGFYYNNIRKKLGLEQKLPEDEKLIDELFDVMHETGTDFTNCFLILEELNNDINLIVQKLLGVTAPEEHYLKRFKPLYEAQYIDQIKEFIKQHEYNIIYLERQGLSLEFLKKQEEKLMRYDQIKNETNELRKKRFEQLWQLWIQKYHKRIQIESNQERQILMRQSNPRIVLRNHLAQECIELAEKGNYDLFHQLYKNLQTPFEQITDKRFTTLLTKQICVSCSS